MTKPLVFVFSVLLLTILAASFTLAADGLAKTQENVSVVVNLNLAAKSQPKQKETKPQETKPEEPPVQETKPQEQPAATEPVKEEKPAFERLTNQDESSSSVNFEVASEKTKAGTLAETLQATITPFDERVISGNLLYFAEDLNAIVEAIPTQTSEQKQVKSQLMLIVSNLLSKTQHPGADLLKNTLSATVASASASSASGGAQTLDADDASSSTESSIESTEHVGQYSNSISSAANYVAGPIAKTLAHIGLGNISRRAQQLGANLNTFAESHVATIENTLARNVAPVLKSKSLSEIKGTLKKVKSALSSGTGFTALGLNKRIYMPADSKGIRDYIKKHNDKVRKQVGVKSLKEANARLNNYKKVFVNKRLVTKFKGAEKKIKSAGKASKKGAAASKKQGKSSSSAKKGGKRGAKSSSSASSSLKKGGKRGARSSTSGSSSRGGKKVNKSSSAKSSSSRGSKRSSSRSSSGSSSSRQVKKKKTSN